MPTALKPKVAPPRFFDPRHANDNGRVTAPPERHWADPVVLYGLSSCLVGVGLLLLSA